MEFYSGAARQSGRFIAEGFCLRRLQPSQRACSMRAARRSRMSSSVASCPGGCAGAAQGCYTGAAQGCNAKRAKESVIAPLTSVIGSA